MSRLHRILFRVLPLPCSYKQSTGTSHVLLSLAACLRTVPGVRRSGQLSGRPAGDILQVTCAEPGGSRVWHPATLLNNDGVQQWSLGALWTGCTAQEWSGHWVMRSDDTPPTAAQSGGKLRRGAGPRFPEARNVLLTVGLFDEQFTGAAWQVLYGHQSALAVTWRRVPNIRIRPNGGTPPSLLRSPHV